MKKALLVDDDYLVRTYLKMLPGWEQAGFSICADVRDGEEALQVLEQEKIDLVVTDVCMPLMDGIALTKAIRKDYPGVYVIVLSCHDDFEYVKEAMREGADEYVLKNTLNEESLKNLLDAAVKQMESQPAEAVQNRTGQTEAMAAQNRTGQTEASAADKYMFFNRLLSGTLTGDERERQRKLAGVRGRYLNSAVVVMKLMEREGAEDAWQEIRREQYCREFLERFRVKIQESVSFSSHDIELVYPGSGVFCCFLDLSDERRSSVMLQELTHTASFCFKICKEEPERFSIGVSGVCLGADAIRQAYQQARLMVKLCFYESDRIAYYEDGKKPGDVLPQEAEELFTQLDYFRLHHDETGFLKAGARARDAFCRERTDERLVRRWLHRLEQSCGAQEERALFPESIDDLSGILEKMARKFFEGSAETQIGDVSAPVRIAAEYALAHFKEPIGLSDAAEAAGVNSSYLSYLFGQEMGVGFTNYLLARRIEYAKKLLKESNLKMREIAEMAGFRDYHYFSKVFKKTTGVSPAAYRNA